MKCTSSWPILEVAQNMQKMCNINRTYMQNTLTSTGPILELAQNMQKMYNINNLYAKHTYQLMANCKTSTNYTKNLQY